MRCFYCFYNYNKCKSIVAVLFAAFALPAAADHGPGTSGGGLSTPSGETLDPGAVLLSFRSDFTQYERLSDSEVLDRLGGLAGPDGHLDALDWSLVETAGAAWGAGEDVELGASLGFYHGDGLREGHLDAGVFELHEHGVVNGVTDLWLTGKVRVSRGPAGHLALLSGVKLPIGVHSLRGEGERLDPAVQPGSGAVDERAGVAWSRWLSERLTMDTGFQYTFHGRSGHLRIGDRAEVGAALACRLGGLEDAGTRWSAFLEATVRSQRRNDDDGESEEHSGGTTTFLAPGIRASLGGGVTVSLAVPVPVIQRLRGEQQETDFKVAASLTITP